MPQALPIIAYYAATYATQYVALAYLAAFATAVAVGEHQRKKASRARGAAQDAALAARTTMMSMVDGASSRVYGHVRNVDGVLFKATRDEGSDRIYTLVVQVAGHEVQSIDTIYFNDQPVTLDGSGWVLTEPYGRVDLDGQAEGFTVTSGAGSITLAATPYAGSVACTFTHYGLDGEGDTSYALPFTLAGSFVSVSGVGGTVPDGGLVRVTYQTSRTTSYARVRKYTGGAAQDLSSVLLPLFPGLVTSADKFAGPAVLLVDLVRNPDAFPTGVPNISAELHGAKDLVDPRTSVADYSENPAVIARDWSLYPYGGGAAVAELDDASFIAAANACDTATTFTRPSGAVTLPLYEAGIVCKLDASPTAALDEIVEAMAGKWAFSGGRLRVVAGTYRTPTVTITEDWLSDAGSIDTLKDPAAADMVNSYRATASNRENAYIVEPMPPVRPASYLAADGAEYNREITMAAVTHPAQAQHIQGVLLRDARQGLTVSLSTKMHGVQLEVFDTAYLTLPRYGYTAKPVEVLSAGYSLDGGFRFTFKETSAAIYTPDAGFADLGNDDNTSLPLPWEVPHLVGLGVTSGTVLTDTTQPVTRTLVSWLPVNSNLVGEVEIQWQDLTGEQVAGDWTNAAGELGGWVNAAGQLGAWLSTTTEPGSWQSMRVDARTTTATIPALKPGHGYVFRARFLRAAVGTIGAQAASNNVAGMWSVQVTAVISSAPLVDTGVIAPGAATDVYTNTPTTATTITAQKHTPDDYAWNTEFASITVVAKEDGVATVSVEGTVDYINSTSFASFQYSVQDKNVTYDGWKRQGVVIAPSATVAVPFHTTRSFPVTKGTSYAFAGMGNKFNAGDTASVSQHEMRVELIYR